MNRPYRESQRPSPNRQQIKDRNKALNSRSLPDLGQQNVEKYTKTEIASHEILTFVIAGGILLIIFLIVIFSN